MGIVKFSLPSDPTLLVANAGVEFVAGPGVHRIFGLTEHRARMLALEGKIRIVHVKRPGAAYGLRLYDAASIRAFLTKHYEKPKRPSKRQT